MSTNSFYVRASVSPCERWLATGGTSGSAFLFDVGANRDDKLVTEGVELRGQEGEVGAVDWASDSLVTCADDGTVRIWRPDIGSRSWSHWAMIMALTDLGDILSVEPLQWRLSPTRKIVRWMTSKETRGKKPPGKTC